METKEIWKNSKTFDGVIQVSNFGNFRRKVTAINSKGKQFTFYEKEIPVNEIKSQKVIHHKGKNVYAKRIVAEVFVKGFETKKAVKFKDGNINNFHPDNLELTNRYCGSYGDKNHKAKLKDKDVLEIVALYKKRVNYKVIAEQFKIHPLNVYRIARNEIWKHVKREPVIRHPRKSK